MRIRDYIRLEVQTHPQESLFRIVGKILLVPGFNAVYLIRRAQLTKSSLLWWYYTRKLAMRYGIHIGRNTVIGPGLVMPHPSSIIIGEGVVIGENCTVYQQTTIGLKEHAQTEYPSIGNDVVIYAGAKIIGAVRIGNHVSVAANAVVTKDCPDYCVAKGVPAQCVKKKSCI